MTTFTGDWFSHNIPNFLGIKQYLGTVDSIMEIGSHEGRSSCWMLENMLSDTGTITCLDPWMGPDREPFSFEPIADHNQPVLDRFIANTFEVKKPGQTVDQRIGRSYSSLAQLITEKRQYDFIYLDGNHTSHASLADATMCWGLLRKGGVLLFDDYLWDHEEDHLERCKMSIDAFVNMYGKYLKVVISNYQQAVIKL